MNHFGRTETEVSTTVSEFDHGDEQWDVYDGQLALPELGHTDMQTNLF